MRHWQVAVRPPTVAGMNRKLALVAAPLLLVTMASVGWAPPVPFHPHFPKTLECRVSQELTVTVRYQTVTFDKAGAEKMAAGKAWHLAGATFATTGDLVVGGQEVKAGRYALSARKTKKGGWELTLHEGRGFSRPGDDAIVLATELDENSLLYEHMSIDVQPAGDKEHTRLQLEVRFDTMWARTLIEVPDKTGGDKGKK